MSKSKEHVGSFIKNIFEDNYSEAKNSLSSAVSERIKEKMRDQIKEDKQQISKGE